MRATKIVESAFQNVYHRRSEWYKNDNKKLFYAPISESIYSKSVVVGQSGRKSIVNTCLPLKEGAFEQDCKTNMDSISKRFPSGVIEYPDSKFEDSKNPEVPFSKDQMAFIKNLEAIGVKFIISNIESNIVKAAVKIKNIEKPVNIEMNLITQEFFYQRQVTTESGTEMKMFKGKFHHILFPFPPSLSQICPLEPLQKFYERIHNYVKEKKLI